MKKLTTEQLKADRLALEKHWVRSRVMLEKEQVRRDIAEAKLIDRHLIDWAA